MTFKESIEALKGGEYLRVTAENCMCETWDGLIHEHNGKTYTYKKIETSDNESTFIVSCIV